MTLTQYQAAAEATADPRAYDYDYLVPMIVGEIGELLGHQAKAHWHGKSKEALQIELVSEFGDICWGTAILLKVEGVSEASPAKRWQENTLVENPLPSDAIQMLLRRSTYLYMFHADGQQNFIADEGRQLWWTLETFCEHITGHNFEYVLQRNLQKLADRAARGVLKGSGDHR